MGADWAVEYRFGGSWVQIYGTNTEERMCKYGWGGECGDGKDRLEERESDRGRCALVVMADADASLTSAYGELTFGWAVIGRLVGVGLCAGMASLGKRWGEGRPLPTSPEFEVGIENSFA